MPLVLVLASLSLAILLPRLTLRRIARLRDEINNVADPARLRTAEIQLALALEGSARRGYLITGDRQLANQFNDTRVQRRASERQLLDYTRRLDAPGSSKLTTLVLRIQVLDRELDSLVGSVDASTASPATLNARAAPTFPADPAIRG